MKINLSKTSGLLILTTMLILPETVFGQFPGLGGGGAPGGGRTGGGRTGGTRGSGSSAALQAQSKVVIVADERSNSLIVLAPDDQLATIEELVKELDGNVDDVTEVRVFPLKNADPTEMADQLNQLFGDTTTRNNSQTGFQSPFSFGRFTGGGTQGNSNNNRALRSDQKVTAVPDPRTSALIISAPRQMMASIEKMVEQLDASPARKQNVYVYSLEHADANNMAEILRGMFEGQSSRNTQRTTTQTSPLSNRSTTFGRAGATSGQSGLGGAGGARGGAGGGIGGR
mgnify:CR=1 FL=1